LFCYTSASVDSNELVCTKIWQDALGFVDVANTRLRPTDGLRKAKKPAWSWRYRISGPLLPRISYTLGVTICQGKSKEKVQVYL